MTDPKMADATYIEPMTVDTARQIIEIERRAQKSATSAGKSAEVETALHDMDADPDPVATSVDDTAGKTLEEAAA